MSYKHTHTRIKLGAVLITKDVETLERYKNNETLISRLKVALMIIRGKLKPIALTYSEDKRKMW